MTLFISYGNWKLKMHFFLISNEIPKEMVIKFERNKDRKNSDISPSVLTSPPFTILKCVGPRLRIVGRSSV